jgi:hypothetical protein
MMPMLSIMRVRDCSGKPGLTGRMLLMIDRILITVRIVFTSRPDLKRKARPDEGGARPKIHFR